MPATLEHERVDKGRYAGRRQRMADILSELAMAWAQGRVSVDFAHRLRHVLIRGMQATTMSFPH